MAIGLNLFPHPTSQGSTIHRRPRHSILTGQGPVLEIPSFHFGETGTRSIPAYPNDSEQQRRLSLSELSSPAEILSRSNNAELGKSHISMLSRSGWLEKQLRDLQVASLILSQL